MNEIKFIDKDYFGQIMNSEYGKCHIAIIDGKDNRDWNSYIKTIEELYKFPTKDDNYAGYDDWMCDLSWFDVDEFVDEFVLFIINYDEFLSDDLKIKNIVMEGFKDSILPWWDEDVEKYVVEGRKRKFNVFIIK